jgi:hypothetical protein
MPNGAAGCWSREPKGSAELVAARVTCDVVERIQAGAAAVLTG